MRFLSFLLLSAVCAFGAGELSNRRAPGFALPDSAARMHDPQDYRGKVLIVDFMQVGCPHCVKFSAILEQARVRYGEKIAVLSIVNPPSDAKGVAAYITQNNVKNPILFDCGQVAFSYLRPSPANPSIIIPHVFLIDGAGMIRNDFTYGADSTTIFEGAGLFTEIDKLLGAKPAR